MNLKWLAGFVGIFLLLVIIGAGAIIHGLYQPQETQLINSLSGEIMYLKRNEKGINEIWKSDANQKNSVKLYSHQGEQNNNVIEYYWNASKQLVYFTAMHKGELSLFEISENGGKAELIKKLGSQQFMLFTANQVADGVLSNRGAQGELITSEGSIFLIKPDGKQEVLLTYNGDYDEKLSPGYTNPVFSPDGRYVVFGYNGHNSQFTMMLFGLIRQQILGDYNLEDRYLLDLDSRKITKYLDGTSLQWKIRFRTPFSRSAIQR
ncbi:MAG: TolB family protein [Thermincolia bacterium]